MPSFWCRQSPPTGRGYRDRISVFDRYVYDDFVRLRQRYAISERYFSIIKNWCPGPSSS